MILLHHVILDGMDVENMKVQKRRNHHYAPSNGSCELGEKKGEKLIGKKLEAILTVSPRKSERKKVQGCHSGETMQF